MIAGVPLDRWPNGWCSTLRAVIRPRVFDLHAMVCSCTLGFPNPPGAVGICEESIRDPFTGDCYVKVVLG